MTDFASLATDEIPSIGVELTPAAKVCLLLPEFEFDLFRSAYVNAKLMQALAGELTRDFLDEQPERPVPAAPPGRMGAPRKELINFGVACVMHDLEAAGNSDLLTIIDNCGFGYDQLVAQSGGQQRADELISLAFVEFGEEMKILGNESSFDGSANKDTLQSVASKVVAKHKEIPEADKLQKTLAEFVESMLELLKEGVWWKDVVYNAR